MVKREATRQRVLQAAKLMASEEPPADVASASHALSGAGEAEGAPSLPLGRGKRLRAGPANPLDELV
jgi:hypothetical protein